MIKDTQVLPGIKDIIDEAQELYRKKISITNRNNIPDTTDIPVENPTHWLKIPDVICIFVDMKNSTQLSASKLETQTAKAYQLYTGTAVKIFSEFESPYIDVRGDGALALFDGSEPHRALAAAVTFKTFASHVFTPILNKDTGLDIGSHMGVTSQSVSVKLCSQFPSGFEMV